ncbi:MAG: hypothetical protein R2712_09675 [Vicinamibacterales bacterium]
MRDGRDELHLLARQRLGAPGRDDNEPDGQGEEGEDAGAEHQVARAHGLNRGFERPGSVGGHDAPAALESAKAAAAW